MGFADTVYRSFVSVLGGTTVIAGAWLTGTMISGFLRHSKVGKFSNYSLIVIKLIKLKYSISLTPLLKIHPFHCRLAK